MGCCGAVRGLRWWALPRNAKRGHRRWRGCTRRVLGDVADSRKREIQSGRISGRGLGKRLQAGAAAAKQVHECARKRKGTANTTTTSRQGLNRPATGISIAQKRRQKTTTTTTTTTTTIPLAEPLLLTGAVTLQRRAHSVLERQSGVITIAQGLPRRPSEKGEELSRCYCDCLSEC